MVRRRSEADEPDLVVVETTAVAKDGTDRRDGVTARDIGEIVDAAAEAALIVSLRGPARNVDELPPSQQIRLLEAHAGKTAEDVGDIYDELNVTGPLDPDGRISRLLEGKLSPKQREAVLALAQLREGFRDRVKAIHAQANAESFNYLRKRVPVGDDGTPSGVEDDRVDLTDLANE
jgi:hypothetical protein